MLKRPYKRDRKTVKFKEFMMKNCHNQLPINLVRIGSNQNNTITNNINKNNYKNKSKKVDTSIIMD